MFRKKKSSNLDLLRQLTVDFAEHGEELASIAEVLASSGDICYIADIDTHELLWANNITKKLFGKDIIGKKCYEALQNTDTPCDFCTNTKLEQGKVYKWVFRNPIINKTFLIRDRLIRYKGKTARFEQAIEIDDVDRNSL